MYSQSTSGSTQPLSHGNTPSRGAPVKKKKNSKKKKKKEERCFADAALGSAISLSP